MRFVTPILSLLAILAVGLNFWLDYRRGGLLAPPIAAPSPTSLSGKIAAETSRFPVEGLADSVFLVVIEGIAEKQRYGTATAFLVDQKCGIFATNAHVAETLTPDARVVLRQPGTDVELEVTAAKVHPAYLRMREIFDEIGPILEFRRTKKGKEFENSVPNLQFDFGLLYTQTNPGEKDCKLPDGVTLPRALPLASPETLAKIQAGQSVAVVGYPGSGNFSASLAPLAALPRVDFGTIRAIGSALPPSKPGQNAQTVLDTVLFHSAATIGGSSGSPIVNAAGEVIAVHARGVASNGQGRLYQEGAADSVESLRLMLDGTAEAALPQYAAAIRERVKGYVPISAYARSSALETVKTAAQKYGMQESASDSGVAQVEFGSLDYSGCVSQNRNCVSAESISKDFYNGRFAILDLPLDTSKTNILHSIDFDQDVDLASLPEAARKKFADMRGITFMCPLKMVLLAPGKEPDSYLIAQESELETLANMLLPAAHGGQQTIKLLVYRPPFCSSGFPKAQIVVTPVELKPGPRKDETVSMLDQLGGALADAVNSVGDAVLPADWSDGDESGGHR